MAARLRLAVASAIIGLTAIAVVAPVLARQQLTKQDADRFETKMARIVSFGKTARSRAATAARVSTPILDSEVNAYFRYNAAKDIPVGIVEPTLTALGDGRVGGEAIVDLDAVRRQKARGWLDPLGYLTGSLPLTASGLLITKDGVGRFQLESAAISGVPVPKSVLQELLSYYSRTPENPAGLGIDDPFELPAQIREIRVERGRATVVQ
jgi:hypothetical protein